MLALSTLEGMRGCCRREKSEDRGPECASAARCRHTARGEPVASLGKQMRARLLRALGRRLTSRAVSSRFRTGRMQQILHARVPILKFVCEDTGGARSNLTPLAFNPQYLRHGSGMHDTWAAPLRHLASASIMPLCQHWSLCQQHAGKRAAVVALLRLAPVRGAKPSALLEACPLCSLLTHSTCVCIIGKGLEGRAGHPCAQGDVLHQLTGRQRARAQASRAT